MDADGTAVLAAHGSVIGDGGKILMTRKRSSTTQQAASREIGAIVAAQNKSLDRFSREIAAEIQQLQ